MARKKNTQRPHDSITGMKCADENCGAITLSHVWRGMETRPAQCARCGGVVFVAGGENIYLPVPIGMRLQKCIGEAHKNPHIDHCGSCMPPHGRWGWVFVQIKPDDCVTE